ncbi:MAG: GWxTD domain-containing protein [Salinivirgaceae bacterium]|jgi:GWxTD domain-containing protein|nr:GWxTD domain-containing protein [Bacteroidales bacterium]
MKRLLLLSILIILFQLSSYGIKAYFHHAQFYAPTVGTYLETYMAIVPNSVAYKINSNNKLQASVEVTMIFTADDVVKEYRKYNISSPEVDTSFAGLPGAFIDLQRIPLPAGSYNFQLLVKDNFSPDSLSFDYKDILTISISGNEPAISGIEPAERFIPTETITKYTKSGYDVIPYVSNFYPNSVNSITFYSELYNIDKEVGAGNDFLIRYFVTSVPSRRMFEKTITLDRRKAAPIVVLTKSVNISDLPSGNYNLEIEVCDKNNEVLLTKKHFFQRSSNKPMDTPTSYANVETKDSWVEKYSTVHELGAHIKSLYPIAGNVERSFIDTDFSAKDLKIMQQFFINFWETRNSIAPESEWEIYRKQVELVDKLYGTQIKRGYMSDRGRVYLQYGSPNQIIKRSNMAFFQPYEIWHFYKINDKNNRRFVFSLVDFGTSEYELVHSDMPGEILNQAWFDIVKGNHLITKENKNIFDDEYDQLRRDYQD